ncbi:MAG TPA: hypothetical protein QGF01_00660 [Candidatus Nitrosopelagicus sp.]|jgi:hypothetical protein|nr:hypothetical protein [Candidatus Nitrosopelagicus sp.]|tara:strand:- start:77 stop:325 length:249 start_codon:yes stop_codon:yes gene_type:complete
MTYPISAEKDGVKIKPELMEKEKLYHCIFNDKVVLLFKDQNEILNCYEIEDEQIVSKVKSSKEEDIEEILEEYISKENLKIK